MFGTATKSDWSLSAIHACWGQRLYGYLVAVVGSRVLADELLGEILERIQAQSDRVAAARDPLAYALRMAANAARDHLRRDATRQARLGAPDTLVLVATANETGLDPDAVALINDAVAALPLPQREVVALKVWEGRTFAEIAEILAVSPNTAASRWRYAAVKLRDTLGGLIDDPA